MDSGKDLLNKPENMKNRCHDVKHDSFQFPGETLLQLSVPLLSIFLFPTVPSKMSTFEIVHFHDY